MEQGAQVNAQDVNLNTALHLAVMQNEYGLIAPLLEYSLVPSLKNRDNLTAVDLASFCQDKHIEREMRSNPLFTEMFSSKY